MSSGADRRARCPLPARTAVPASASASAAGLADVTRSTTERTARVRGQTARPTSFAPAEASITASATVRAARAPADPSGAGPRARFRLRRGRAPLVSSFTRARCMASEASSRSIVYPGTAAAAAAAAVAAAAAAAAAGPRAGVAWRGGAHSRHAPTAGDAMRWWGGACATRTGKAVRVSGASDSARHSNGSASAYSSSPRSRSSRSGRRSFGASTCVASARATRYAEGGTSARRKGGGPPKQRVRYPERGSSGTGSG